MSAAAGPAGPSTTRKDADPPRQDPVNADAPGPLPRQDDHCGDGRRGCPAVRSVEDPADKDTAAGRKDARRRQDAWLPRGRQAGGPAVPWVRGPHGKAQSAPRRGPSFPGEPSPSKSAVGPW
ncbi:hypothetical protein GCM10010359_58770 [Streptomyces morookaense]|nr:hypothetical protein GCM10010359_58770 [Streptomyces morookaense]